MGDAASSQGSGQASDDASVASNNNSWSRFYRHSLRGEHRFTIEDFIVELSAEDSVIKSPVFEFSTGYDTFSFSIHVNLRKEKSDEDSFTSVYLYVIGKRRIQVQFDLWVLSAAQTKVLQKSSYWHEFSSDSNNWGFPKLFSKSELMDRRKELLPNGHLTLGLSLNIRYKSSTEQGNFVQIKQSDQPSLRDNLSHLFAARKFVDLEVVCEGQMFPCHKAILASRSSVFEAMLSQDGFQEAQTSKICISDMDPESVGVFLNFLYTDQVKNEHLNQHAETLLMAADKYDVKRLRAMCEDYFVQNISVANAAEMLLLAHLHRIKSLKEAAVVVAKDNITSVKTSEHWERIKEHPDLLEEMFETLANTQKRVKTSQK